uniref:Putative lipoprotein n=1 Tax=Magnetococcus massalia (strain MO-1) TaxID=451514 RepID=A0A1S7LLH9_MAGMO|nr:putative lipoprotein [Candidatus Magnetococcus massalia]
MPSRDRSQVYGLLLSLLLMGCAAQNTTPTQQATPPPWQSVDNDFQLEDVIKSDVHMVAEMIQREVMTQLKLITERLYRHNPDSWRASDAQSMQQQLARLFEQEHRWQFPQLGDAVGADAIYLAFDPRFKGDRVFAFAGGLGYMIMASYGGKKSFNFLFLDDWAHASSTLDPQRLYNSARNIDVAAWKLFNQRQADGQPYLHSLELEDAQVRDLFFVQSMAKMAAQQDLLARVMAQKGKRRIKHIVHFVATAFLPY